VTALGEWKLGGLYELWRNDRALVSADASIGHGSVLSIDLVRFAEDILDGNFTDPSLVGTDAGTSYDVGLRGALATSGWTGFTADAGLGVNDFGASDGEVRWRAAAAFSMDWGQRGAAPVGAIIKGGISRLSTESFDADANRSLGLSVYYTGREDFQLGLVGSWSHLALRDLGTSMNIKTYQFTLRYFF
jgi:hypothetical protein